MIPRGRLSISYLQLFKSLAFHFRKPKQNIVPLTELYGKSIFCLSARTGLHLSLKALDFKIGSEILVANINIPDMFAILDDHQLISIPVTIDKATLGLPIEELERKLTPRSKAILVTHLFGAIANMEEISAFAVKHNLIVIEDCAQAFNGTYRGHPNTTASLFSFGLIKTNTCLTGAMICFNNGKIFDQVNALNSALPQQPKRKFTQKILKALVIKLMTTSLIYGLLYVCTRIFKKDFDDYLAGFTKGFPGANVMEKILFRPCDSNLWLLSNRTSSTQNQHLQKRQDIALHILAQLPDELKIGHQNSLHSYWVFPVHSNKPVQLIEKLRKNGIDATAKASSLVSLPTDFNSSRTTAILLTDLVYLPIHKAVANRLKAAL